MAGKIRVHNNLRAFALITWEGLACGEPTNLMKGLSSYKGDDSSWQILFSSSIVSPEGGIITRLPAVACCRMLVRDFDSLVVKRLAKVNYWILL